MTYKLGALPLVEGGGAKHSPPVTQRHRDTKTQSTETQRHRDKNHNHKNTNTNTKIETQ